jgi:hypothetical protein
VTERPTTPYDALADEYYNEDLHPTCANFREASRMLVRAWLSSYGLKSPACDLGAGKSLLCEVADELAITRSGIVAVDSGVRMLNHTRAQWPDMDAQCLRAEVSDLPFTSGSQCRALASLGDPYNDLVFWTELARVLCPAGSALFTTPSYAWAFSYRSRVHDDTREAVFQLRHGEVVWTPSVVLDPLSQERMIDEAGLVVTGYAEAAADSLTGRLSPKVRVALGPNDPIVVGYTVARRAP